MDKYKNAQHLRGRILSLYEYGHASNVWEDKIPSEKGYVIELVDSFVVSEPCWKELCDSADFIDGVWRNFQEFIYWDNAPNDGNIYQFWFAEKTVAQKLAAKVQNSARYRRKDLARRVRLKKAGGFHTKQVLENLYEIQEGLCYYTGDRLTRNPKNFTVDHIIPVSAGGTDWPNNLALVLKEINTWKGAHLSPEHALRVLAKERGSEWFERQLLFCHRVDKERIRLDKAFKLRYDKSR